MPGHCRRELCKEHNAANPAREAAFVAAYIANRNASNAAEKAGYSAKTAHVIASRLSRRPRVAAAIKAATDRINKKYEVSAERTVQEMAAIGFSDIGNYRFDEQGYVTRAEGAPQIAMKAVKRIRRKVVSSKIVDEEGKTGTVVTCETETELWNKDAELGNLAKHLKLFSEHSADQLDPKEQLTDEQRGNASWSFFGSPRDEGKWRFSQQVNTRRCQRRPLRRSRSPTHAAEVGVSIEFPE